MQKKYSSCASRRCIEPPRHVNWFSLLLWAYPTSCSQVQRNLAQTYLRDETGLGSTFLGQIAESTKTAGLADVKRPGMMSRPWRMF